MRKKRFLVFSLLVWLFQSAVFFESYAYDLSLRFQSGMYSHSMKSMRLLQSTLMAPYLREGLAVKSFSDFPPYWGFQLQVASTKKLTSWGVGLDYTSTGSRIQYKDYSGTLQLDQILQRFALTLFFEKRAALIGPVRFWGSMQSNCAMTYLDLNSFIQLYSVAGKSGNHFKSFGFSVVPLFEAEIDFEWIFCRLGIGYELVIYQQNLMPGGPTGAFAANWNGLRSIFKIGIPI